MSHVASCPRDEQVVAFHQGRLSEAEMVEVLEHVETCSTCADRFGRLGETPDSFMVHLKRSAQRPPFPEEHDCRALELAALAFEETVSREADLSSARLPPPAPPIMLGPYEVRGRIDGGGMGDVYQAWHTKLKKVVALKLLTPDRARHPAAIARFQREMEASGLVGDHPNVVRATDANEDRGIHYLAMDLIPGRDLSDLSGRVGMLSVADACELMRQAALGLAHLHRHGVIHRDFKPSNIMVTPDGAVKILDLGLAILPRDRPSIDDTLTDAWTVMGTADYMAPEQIFDSHHVTPAADLYSLGCALFRLLAGRAPFEELQYAVRPQKFKAHAMVEAPRLDRFRADAPPELTELLAKLLSKSPGERPASAEAVALELQRFTAGADLPALMRRCESSQSQLEAVFQETPPNPVSPTVTLRGRRRTKRRIAAVAIAIGLLPVAVGIAVRGVPWNSRTVETPEPLEPGRWYSAFRNEPQRLGWDNLLNGSDFKLNRDLETLNVSFRGTVAMLGCGRIDWRDGYSLEVGIDPIKNWGEPIGIFFGYNERRENGDHYYEYQTIQLEPYHLEKNREAAFRLARTKVWGKNDIPRTKHLGLSDTIPWPDKGEIRLSMKYLRLHKGIVEITWGNRKAVNLVRPETNAGLKHEDYLGQFGIYQRNDAVTYRGFRFALANEGDAP